MIPALYLSNVVGRKMALQRGPSSNPCEKETLQMLIKDFEIILDYPGLCYRSKVITRVLKVKEGGRGVREGHVMTEAESE